MISFIVCCGIKLEKTGWKQAIEQWVDPQIVKTSWSLTQYFARGTLNNKLLEIMEVKLLILMNLTSHKEVAILFCFKWSYRSNFTFAAGGKRWHSAIKSALVIKMLWVFWENREPRGKDRRLRRIWLPRSSFVEKDPRRGLLIYFL